MREKGAGEEEKKRPVRGGGGVSKENDVTPNNHTHTHKKKNSCQNSCTHDTTEFVK